MQAYYTEEPLNQASMHSITEEIVQYIKANQNIFSPVAFMIASCLCVGAGMFRH